MAYDEFTAKMVRRVDALEQALAEKEREITHLQDVYTKQRHKQEDAQRQVIEGLQKRLALLQADDAERCTLIRDMEEEERKKDAVIEQQRQEIARLREVLVEIVEKCEDEDWEYMFGDILIQAKQALKKSSVVGGS